MIEPNTPQARIESRLLWQYFEVVDQVSQIVVADIPTRHVCFQLCAIHKH
jgi:hypothetical protein